MKMSWDCNICCPNSVVVFFTASPVHPVIKNKEKEIFHNSSIKWNSPDANGCPVSMFSVYYKAIKSRNKESAWHHINTSSDANELSCSSLPLECGTDYEFKVSASNDVAESNFSESWQAKSITAIAVVFLYLYFSLNHLEIVGKIGNPSVIQGQTANILTSWSRVWARCSTSSREIYEKYLTSLLAEKKRRIMPTKFFHNYLTLIALYKLKNKEKQKRKHLHKHGLAQVESTSDCEKLYRSRLSAKL